MPRPNRAIIGATMATGILAYSVTSQRESVNVNCNRQALSKHWQPPKGLRRNPTM